MGEMILTDAGNNRHGIRRFLEVKLQEYFQFLEMVSKPQNQYQENAVGLLRFERKSMAPEATRIPSYPTGPRCF